MVTNLENSIFKFGFFFSLRSYHVFGLIVAFSAQLDESCRITIRFAKLDACIYRDDSFYSYALSTQWVKSIFEIEL